jgi:hypothetical protein
MRGARFSFVAFMIVIESKTHPSAQMKQLKNSRTSQKTHADMSPLFAASSAEVADASLNQSEYCAGCHEHES